MDKATRAMLAEYMRGYAGLAGLAGLEHSSARLQELEPEVATLFEDMAKLWTIPLDDSEMAVSFAIEKVDGNV
jgi:hypothetical protein